MYIPRSWHFIGPVSVILIGFVIHEHFNNSWEVIVFVNAPLAPIAWEWARYIQRAGVAYQMYVTNTQGASPIKAELLKDISKDEPKFVPTLRPIQQDYTQTVDLPKFDVERNFAVTILRMYDFDPRTQKHVDMTEGLWVKTKKQFSQIPFKNMKEKWIHFGLAMRENEKKNARYIVKSRQAIALVASGNPLPDWSPPPLS